jgi:peptidylprolyl isomerase
VSRISRMIAVAAVAALALTGCSGTGSGGDSDGSRASCEATTSGTNAKKLDVTGAFGTAPEVKFPTPLSAKTTERAVVIKGTGKVAETGTIASVNYTVYSATTGKQVDTTKYDAKKGATDFPVDAGQLLAGIVKTVHCAPAGSRVAAVIPPADAFQATGAPQFGIGPTDSLVFVIDVVSVKAPKKAAPALPKANGADQPAEKGFPAVKVAADGTPTVTIPDAAPPTELKIAVLKKGTGATVPESGSVVVHYVGVNWNTKKTFDESWSKGAPATFDVAQVIPGFSKAIIGQKVGSQVIAIVPPAEGYGEKGAGTDIGGTDTLVFVIDILGLG